MRFSTLLSVLFATAITAGVFVPDEVAELKLICIAPILNSVSGLQTGTSVTGLIQRDDDDSNIEGILDLVELPKDTTTVTNDNDEVDTLDDDDSIVELPADSQDETTELPEDSEDNTDLPDDVEDEVEDDGEDDVEDVAEGDGDDDEVEDDDEDVLDVADDQE